MWGQDIAWFARLSSVIASTKLYCLMIEAPRCEKLETVTALWFHNNTYHTNVKLNKLFRCVQDPLISRILAVFVLFSHFFFYCCPKFLYREALKPGVQLTLVCLYAATIPGYMMIVYVMLYISGLR